MRAMSLARYTLSPFQERMQSMSRKKNNIDRLVKERRKRIAQTIASHLRRQSDLDALLNDIASFAELHGADWSVRIAATRTQGQYSSLEPSEYLAVIELLRRRKSSEIDTPSKCIEILRRGGVLTRQVIELP